MGQQLALSLAYRPALAREDFLVSDANEQAVAWLDRWPDWPGPGLVVIGPRGCGKSHLAAVWRERSGAGDLAGRLTEAGVPELAERAAHWLLDDADRFLETSGAAGERALLHLYNLIRDREGSLLLTMSKAPAGLSTGLADLRSRLGALPAVTVKPPDEALLAGLLVKQFADRQLDVGEDVIRYIMARTERSFEGVRRAVAQIDTYALARRRRVTVRLLRELWPDARR